MTDLNMECYPEEKEEFPLVNDEEEDDDSAESAEESDESSEELERDIVIRGQRPHLFKPLAIERRQGDGENGEAYRHQRRNTDANRLQNNEWCQCGSCLVHPSFDVGDLLCCKEIPEVVDENNRLNVDCITMCASFHAAILDPISLYIGWLEYTERWRQTAKSFEDRTNEKYRYVAYRRFVRWCWGWLGKDIRVQIPACVHAKVMMEFPDDQGNYRGTILRPLEVE